MPRKRAPHTTRTLTPRHQLPRGHQPRKHTLIMRDKRKRRQNRAHRKARGWRDD